MALVDHQASEISSDETLLELAKCGHVAATELLIGRYRPLVEQKAKAYHDSPVPWDALLQEGMIGLSQAVNDFRLKSSVSFRHFVELYVVRQMIAAVREATREHEEVVDDLRLHGPGPRKGDSFLDGIRGRNPAPLFGSKLPNDVVDLLASILSERERQVLSCYLEGMTYHEMCDRLHMPYKAIDNALQRVKRKIAAIMQT